MIFKTDAAAILRISRTTLLGTMKRYGLDYETMSAINPRLVYCSVTGFGQTGPYKDRPGYDFMAQGMGGLMSITGERDDLPGGGPQRVGIPIIDLTTGMYASIAICAAIAHRAVTGQGQWIDVARRSQSGLEDSSQSSRN